MRPGQIAAAAASLPAADESGLVANAEPRRSQRIVAFFSDYFSRHLPLLVTLWLLGVLFLTLRFSGSMLYLQRLKYRQNRPLPAPWPERLQLLAEKAGLRRPLQLLESLRLQTPVVIGHFKPVLLLPAGLVAGLPVDEVEALLAHELAHVMRRDYLVNVLQNLVEILYFFHPGVRWISAAVRQEREHCCDDFAVALCGDAQNYARALARLQTAGTAYPEPALAAVGRSQKLLRRIVRLLGRPRLAHDFREGFVSALLLVFGMLGMLKLAAAVDGVPVGESAGVEVNGKMAGDIPAKPGVPLYPAPAGPPGPPAPAVSRFNLVHFLLETVGTVKLEGTFTAGADAAGSGTWLVDGRDGQVIWFMDLAQASDKGSFSAEVPLGSGAYSWYRPGGWKVTAQWKGAAAARGWEPLTMLIGSRADAAGLRQHAETERRLEEKEREQQARSADDRKKKEQELEQAKAQQVAQAEKERLQKEKELRRVEQKMKGMDEKERRAKEKELRILEQELADMAAAQLELEQAKREASEEERHSREMAEKSRLQGERAQAAAQADLARLKDQEKRMQAEALRMRAEEERMRAEEKNFRALIAELAAAGLVNGPGRYEIRISADRLLVNGKKQPAHIYERIKKFYEAQFNKKLTEERSVTIVNDK